MYWRYDWAWGLPVLVLTVVAHVYVLVLALEALVRLAPNAKRKPNLLRSVAVLALTALGAATLHGLEAAVWAYPLPRHWRADERAERNVVFARRHHELWSRRNLSGGTLAIVGRDQGCRRTA